MINQPHIRIVEIWDYKPGKGTRGGPPSYYAIELFNPENGKAYNLTPFMTEGSTTLEHAEKIAWGVHLASGLQVYHAKEKVQYQTEIIYEDSPDN